MNKKVAVCLVVKNEEQEILYWISWYKMLGFDSIIIYDDFSDDATENVILSIMPTIDIRYFRNAPNHDLHNIRQVRAYNDAIYRYKDEFDWIALFDADEYLDLYGVDIKTFLQQHEDASLIAFNWCNAGTNGFVSRPEGPPFTNYTHHGKNELYWNRHTKVIFRPQELCKDLYHVHNAPVHGKCIDSNGEPIQWDGPDGGFTANSPSWKGGRLRHYQSRSLEHYVKRNRNLEDLRRDTKDPLHHITTNEEYNSEYDPMPLETINKAYAWMDGLSQTQVQCILRKLRACPSNFWANCALISQPPNVPIFDPTYDSLPHEITHGWISSKMKVGNIFKNVVPHNHRIIPFTIENAFGSYLSSTDETLSISTHANDHLIGIYVQGSDFVHLFPQKHGLLKAKDDPRTLRALTYKIWGNGEHTASFSHPRTGRFMGFTPEGDHTVRKMRSLAWEHFFLHPIEWTDVPFYIQEAALYLNQARSLEAIKSIISDTETFAINAITALDTPTVRMLNFVCGGIIGENLI